MRILILLIVAQLVPLMGAAQSSLSVNLEYKSLGRASREAFEAKDYQAFLNAVTRQRELCHGSAPSTYRLAYANARTGKKKEALRWLRVYVDMGQTLDSQDTDWAGIADDPEFQAMARRAAQNQQTTHNSSKVFGFTDANLLTEDISYDAKRKSMFVTSVLEKKVLQITDNGRRTREFLDLSREPGWPLFAVATDPDRGAIWVTAAALPDFQGSPKADYGKTILLKFDVRSRKLLAKVVPPDHEQRVLGDLAIGPKGEVAVSDGLGGGVYLFTPGDAALQAIDGGEFISPQTPAFTADGRYLFVPDYVRGIARIERASKKIIWLKHEESFALNGIDGMSLRGTELIAVQNGTSPARVVALSLNKELDRVERLRIVEANTEGLGDPTHGTFVGDDFYFIANSGWSFLDDSGKVKSGQTMTPAQVWRFKAGDLAP